jgi:prefoldin subunit 5
MTNSDLKPQLERLKVNMAELRRSISELRSTVPILANLMTIQQQEAERDQAETNRWFDQSR